MSEITGYFLVAADGEVGRIEDLIVEDESWAIRYLLVNTCNWLTRKSVVISPQWIKRID